jgi:methyl-accepting chemotaxis protein
MTEITATIIELLATSRQIAESAQRIALVAGETSAAARTGDHAARKTHESVSGIKRQVDLIVNHMLDLGRQSQHIGLSLEIIDELAEHTNLLALNATLEASGDEDAGESVAVVAEEIGKLAGRVSGSMKQIRPLIEEIRAAIDASAMTAEDNSTAVDITVRQFVDMTAALQRLLGTLPSPCEILNLPPMGSYCRD